MTRIAHTTLDSVTGYACVIHAGRHELTADESTARGGTDTGPAPYQLLLSSLAACTAITLRMVAARKGWELGSIHVDVELHKDDGADRIARAITLSAPLSAEQKATLADIVEKTPVTKTIKAGAPIETTFLKAGRLRREKRDSRRLQGPAPAFLGFAAALLPGGAAKARAARGALGVLQGVLAQPYLQRQAHRLGQLARGVLEALDDRVRLDRVAGGEARPDEFPGRGRPAVVAVGLALAPHQGPLLGVDAVAELERSQLPARLAHEQVEVVVVKPAPLARGVVLQYVENLSQHHNAPTLTVP